MSSRWDEEFDPSTGARNTLRWAHEMGASTLGEAYDMLEQLEISNDVPEVLGHDYTVEDVREELELGIEIAPGYSAEHSDIGLMAPGATKLADRGLLENLLPDGPLVEHYVDHGSVVVAHVRNEDGFESLPVPL